MVTYRKLLESLKEIEANDTLNYVLDSTVTVKLDDEYYGVQDQFTHWDEENPSGDGVIEEGQLVLEII